MRDPAHEEDLRAVARAAVARCGRIDTWVDNASVYIQGRVQDLTLDEYRRVLDVNVVGTIDGTQCALDVMLPQGSGGVVQVSSVAARHGVPYTTPYSAAKAAHDGFTSALRAVWGSGVRLSILYPPTVDTPICHQSCGTLGVVPEPVPPIADSLEAARHRAPGPHRGAPPLPRVGRPACRAPCGLARGRRLASTPRRGADVLGRARRRGRQPGHAVGGRRRPSAAVGGRRRPSAAVAPPVRAGSARPGWNGLTLGEIARVLPWDAVLGAAALGWAGSRCAT